MKRKLWIRILIPVLIALGVLFVQRARIAELLEKEPVDELVGKQVDIILFMGQSYMSGANGDAAQAPEVPVGQGFEYKAVTEPSGLSYLQEPFGAEEHREGLLDDREILERRGTMASAFVNAYYQETETPVVAVAASRGSSSMNSWLERLAGDAISRLTDCRSYLAKEGVLVRHCYMVWMQGEADANKERTKEQYYADMTSLMDLMEASGVEKCFLIQIGDHVLQPDHHTEIQEAQMELCENDDRMILASDLPAKLDDKVDETGVHFTQEALNLIGEDAGHSAGYAVSNQFTFQ